MVVCEVFAPYVVEPYLAVYGVFVCFFIPRVEDGAEELHGFHSHLRGAVRCEDAECEFFEEYVVICSAEFFEL